jgi:predicted nucleic acid-binding protein
MPYFTYDTSVIISRQLVDLPQQATNFLLSAVVLMELAASATDASQRKVYEQLFQNYREDNSLIVPNEDDWLLASKVLYWLSQARRRSGGGSLRRLD